jgi:hypothetical protein
MTIDKKHFWQVEPQHSVDAPSRTSLGVFSGTLMIGVSGSTSVEQVYDEEYASNCSAPFPQFGQVKAGHTA